MPGKEETLWLNDDSTGQGRNRSSIEVDSANTHELEWEVNQMAIAQGDQAGGNIH